MTRTAARIRSTTTIAGNVSWCRRIATSAGTLGAGASADSRSLVTHRPGRRSWVAVSTGTRRSATASSDSSARNLRQRACSGRGPCSGGSSHWVPGSALPPRPASCTRSPASAATRRSDSSTSRRRSTSTARSTAPRQTGACRPGARNARPWSASSSTARATCVGCRPSRRDSPAADVCSSSSSAPSTRSAPRLSPRLRRSGCSTASSSGGTGPSWAAAPGTGCTPAPPCGRRDCPQGVGRATGPADGVRPDSPTTCCTGSVSRVRHAWTGVPGRRGCGRGCRGLQGGCKVGCTGARSAALHHPAHALGVGRHRAAGDGGLGPHRVESAQAAQQVGHVTGGDLLGQLLHVP